MTIPRYITEQFSDNPSALVELYQLDTTSLLPAPQGQVYYWTPGTLPQSYKGFLTQVTNPNRVVLDTIVSQAAGSLNTYRFTLVSTEDGSVLQDLPCTIGPDSGSGRTGVVTASNLSPVPSVGAAYVLYGPGYVYWQGRPYIPLPIEASGYEVSGQGKLPRPTLKVANANVGGLIAALTIAASDLLGAKVTRYRLFADQLDGQPFEDDVFTLSPDVFIIDRKTSHNKEHIEFEMVAGFDAQGLKLPRLKVFRDACRFTYRRWNAATSSFIQGTCPWADTSGRYFDITDTGTSDPSQDNCSLHFSGCTARYGMTADLPFGGFPGSSLTQTYG